MTFVPALTASDRRGLLAKHGRPVPRYTSYPTAPHFSPAVNGATYAHWLAALPAGTATSLYVHVPFCAELCLYCGCTTSVARTLRPVQAYAARLLEEMALVAAHLASRLPVTHLHFGGGTPTMLEAAELGAIMARLREMFDLRPGAEIAIEIDPRVLGAAKAELLGASGFTRASLGVQDFDDRVQDAIGRRQSFSETEAATRALRSAGIGSINLDLVYGLPHQTVASVLETLDQALALDPDRIAVFGYAHVPWMKKHQALIPEAALPGPLARLDQAEAIAGRLTEAGYQSIGLDHFAKPADALARKARDGEMRRNFQGYTTDDAPALLGFGPSAISAPPQGYVQNITATPAWHAAVAAGDLPVARGIAVSTEDCLRREIIERLMCDLAVDVDALCARHRLPAALLADAFAMLEPLADDGLVVREGGRLRIPERARPFARVVCAAFDAYLPRPQASDAPVPRRHSAAV